MDATRFDALTRVLSADQPRRPSRRALLALLGGGLAVGIGPTLDAAARRKKKHKNRRGGGGGGGGGGGTLDVFDTCDPELKECKAGLRCDSPTTAHTCSSTVEGVDTWCCVPLGGKCTECECCGDAKCDFGDANPDGACIRNPEG